MNRIFRGISVGERLPESGDATLFIVQRGRGPFVMLRCGGCGHEGWFGKDEPDYCVKCGKKFIKPSVHE